MSSVSRTVDRVMWSKGVGLTDIRPHTKCRRKIEGKFFLLCVGVLLIQLGLFCLSCLS